MANIGTGTVGYTVVGTGNGSSPTFVPVGAMSGVPSNAVVINGPGFLSGFTGIVLSNGQLPIGSTGVAPVAATLTAGTGVTITNGAGSITISATGGSFAWVDVTTATQALAVQTGYITDHSGGVVYTLPATAAIGDQIRILGKQTSWSIAQNATQQIVVSSASSTVGTGGSVASTNLGDCIWLVCITAGTATVWRAESFVGNLTVT
jgi:hypothetical protein